MKKTNKKVEEKDLNTEVSEKEVKGIKQEKVFTNITKLKCDYTVYKRERTNCKMPVEEKCAKCGKKFKEGDELYIASINGHIHLHCDKCNISIMQ